MYRYTPTILHPLFSFSSFCFFIFDFFLWLLFSFLPSLFLFFLHFLSVPRVRQFIEMVNGTDSEVRCLGGRSPKSQDSYPGSPRSFSSPSHKASSSQPYLTGTVQLLSRHSHLEIRTDLKSTPSTNTAPFTLGDKITFLQPQFLL